jgi:hypothetical protein
MIESVEATLFGAAVRKLFGDKFFQNPFCAAIVMSPVVLGRYHCVIYLHLIS